MAILLVTVGIGILKGLDLVDFDRNTLLTHVHAGTLGWITLSVFSATAWLFADQGRPVPRLLRDGAIVAVALYVLAFWSGNLSLRPAAGALAFAAIAWFLWWTVAASRRVPLTVPRLSMLAALTTLALGAVFGVLLGLELAGKADFLPDGLAIAHPTTLVIGYLILAGMAIDEWRLGGAASPGRMSRWGVAQVVLLFLGGLTLTVGALLDSFPLIAMNVPLEVLGVAIFLVRTRRQLASIRWVRDEPGRQFGMSIAFLAANVGLLAYLIVSYADRIEEIPRWLIFALDHTMFIGVMTNAIFGLLYAWTNDRRVWPWAERVTFWGVNVGMVGFVVGLILREAVLKQIFTRVMGTSILVSLLAIAVRLGSRPAPAEVAPPAANR